MTSHDWEEGSDTSSLVSNPSTPRGHAATPVPLPPSPARNRANREAQGQQRMPRPPGASLLALIVSIIVILVAPYILQRPSASSDAQADLSLVQCQEPPRLFVPVEEPRAGEWLVMLDMSVSMGSHNRTTKARVSLTKIKDSMGPEDRLQLIAFNGHVRTVLPLTPVAEISPVMWAGILDEMRPEGSTALHDAIGRGLAVVKSRLGRPWKVIIVTDGEDSASREYTRDQAVAMISKLSSTDHDVAIYLLGVSSANDVCFDPHCHYIPMGDNPGHDLATHFIPATFRHEPPVSMDIQRPPRPLGLRTPYTAPLSIRSTIPLPSKMEVELVPDGFFRRHTVSLRNTHGHVRLVMEPRSGKDIRHLPDHFTVRIKDTATGREITRQRYAVVVGDWIADLIAKSHGTACGEVINMLLVGWVGGGKSTTLNSAITMLRYHDYKPYSIEAVGRSPTSFTTHINAINISMVVDYPSGVLPPSFNLISTWGFDSSNYNGTGGTLSLAEVMKGYWEDNWHMKQSLTEGKREELRATAHLRRAHVVMFVVSDMYLRDEAVVSGIRRLYEMTTAPPGLRLNPMVILTHADRTIPEIAEEKNVLANQKARQRLVEAAAADLLGIPASHVFVSTGYGAEVDRSFAKDQTMYLILDKALDLAHAYCRVNKRAS